MKKKCNSNQKWNNDKCPSNYKKHYLWKKIIFGIPIRVVVKMVNI